MQVRATMAQLKANFATRDSHYTVFIRCPAELYTEYVRLHESLSSVKPCNLTFHICHGCFPQVLNILIRPVAMSQQLNS